MRCALYLRHSTDKAKTENQRPEVEQLARARGYEVTATFAEGASPVKKRPDYERMMKAARRGAFDLLVVWVLDRFGRSMVGNLNDVVELDRIGVTVVSVRESWLDTGSPVRNQLIAIFWIVRHLSYATILVALLSGCSGSTEVSASGVVPNYRTEPFRPKPVTGCSPSEASAGTSCSVCSPVDADDCEKHCRSGDGGGCYLQGVSLELDRNDYPAAAAAFERGCQLGSGGSCESFGRLLMIARGVSKDEERAAAILAKMCAAGRRHSCTLLGEAHFVSKRDFADRATGLRLLNAACREGAEEACQLLENLQVLETDPDAAIKSARHRSARCKSGDESMCARAH